MLINLLKLIFFLIISSIIFGLETSFSASDCNYDADNALDINTAISNCLNNSDIVNPSSSIKVSEKGFKDIILRWVKSLSTFLSVGAVFSIVYGAFMMTLSLGEDEKIKKGKDLVKWGIIGFLSVVFAGVLISVVINFIYGLS